MSEKLGRASQTWTARRRLLACPLILIILFLGARSSFDHRPANMSTVAFCGDPLVNSLSVSSTYSLGYAIYGLRDESDLVHGYGKMANDEIIRRVHKGMGLPDSAFTNPNIPTLHRQIPKHKRERPLNLVIILEESLGAAYVQSLGGLPLTPELEKLSQKGLWFSRLYATGTRSIRGVEAVVTGFPPTPARSILKLNLAQHGFFSLASLLKREGYATQFIYGGDSKFDNMRGFLPGKWFRSNDRRKMTLENTFFVAPGGSLTKISLTARTRNSSLMGISHFSQWYSRYPTILPLNFPTDG